MAKDKTRERTLPGWLKARRERGVRVTPAIAGYHQTDAKFQGVYDQYGPFRQGAMLRGCLRG